MYLVRTILQICIDRLYTVIENVVAGGVEQVQGIRLYRKRTKHSAKHIFWF